MTPKYKKDQVLALITSSKPVTVAEVILSENCVQPQYLTTTGHTVYESQLSDCCLYCGAKLDAKGECTDDNCE